MKTRQLFAAALIALLGVGVVLAFSLVLLVSPLGSNNSEAFLNLLERGKRCTQETTLMGRFLLFQKQFKSTREVRKATVHGGRRIGERVTSTRQSLTSLK